jgi:hypothetical protein
MLAVGEKRLTKEWSFFEPQAPGMLTLKMLRDHEWLERPGICPSISIGGKAFFGDSDPYG